MRVSPKGQKEEQQKVKNRLTQCVTVLMLHSLVRHHIVWFTAKRRQTITLCQRQSQPLVDEIQLCSSSEPWEKFCTVKVSSILHCGLIGHFWVAIFLCFKMSLCKTIQMKMNSAYTVDIDYTYILFWDFFLIFLYRRSTIIRCRPASIPLVALCKKPVVILSRGIDQLNKNCFN